MSAPAYTRRLLLVGCACLLSLPFLRKPLSEALLARGDGALSIGRQREAWQFYQRAMAVDRSIRPLGRIATLAILSDDPKLIREAINAEAALKPTRRFASLIFERALLEWREHQYVAAERDSRMSWALKHSVRAIMFAGILARRRGALETADRDFERAHLLAPSDRRPIFQLAKAAKRHRGA